MTVARELGRHDRRDARRGAGDLARVDTLPGFFIATGFSGHGFGIGPGAGRLMADLVTGAAPIVDPAPFRFSRFARRAPREETRPIAEPW